MRPPRVAQLIVAAAVTEPEREFLLGDLEEQFGSALTRRGRIAAWQQYWSQALRSAWHAHGVGRRPRLPQPQHRRPEMSTLWRELRLAVRTAMKSPMYSAITILTLALAIGANTLLFSIASPLAIRPLPIKDAAWLGWIWQSGPSGVDRNPSSMADLLDFRASAKSFAALGGFENIGGTLTGHGDAERVTLARVTANFCDIWGLHPFLGRLFQPGEDRVGHPLAGVLSHRYWQKSFQGDPGVIGKTFLLDGQSITIVGVMEPEIEMGTLQAYDIWVPLPLDGSLPRDQRSVRLVGRLAPGATVESANAEIHGLAQRLAAAHPDTNLNWDARVVSTRQAIVGTNTWLIIALLSVVVTFVLLIACANLANLVLARVVARRHDFAVRQALGASRLQVVRPLLLESLVLSLAGGLVGLAVAQAGLRIINATATDVDPFLKQVGIDGYVLTFAIVLSFLTPFIFSLIPALGAGRLAVAETLRDVRSSGGRRARWQRNLLVGSQVALALSLLVVSGLVVRTMENVHKLQIGLDIKSVLCFRVSLPPQQYRDAAARTQFANEAATRLGVVPGVDAAGVASHLPVFDAETVRYLSGTLHDGTKDAERPWASWFAASPDLFRAAGIKPLAGRTFTASDTGDAPPVAVVSQMAADKYFDGVTNAVGRRVTMHGRGTADDRIATIVGVVADTKNSQAKETSPQIWVPFDQAPLPSMTFVVRSDQPGAIGRDVQAVMRKINPDVAISQPQTMSKMVQDVLADDAILTGLFLGFAILALALAAAGLYGVISYSVGQRQREIGVRLALGAAPATIRRMILADGLKVTGIGMLVGLGLAALMAQGAAAFLYEVTPRDPQTFGIAVGVLLVVAVIAVWSPAARAMRVDPVKTLRFD